MTDPVGREPVLGPVSVATGLLLGIGIIVGVWMGFGSVTDDFNDTRSLIVDRGAGFEQVVDSLAARGILADRFRFETVGKLTGWHRQIKPGYYEIEAGHSAMDLLNILRRGLQTPVVVTVPPGSRPEVVAAVLRRDISLDSTAFREALVDDTLLAELGLDSHLVFGRLKPDTYQFFWGTGPDAVISRLTGAYESFFDERRRVRSDELNLTVDEVLTLASIVEWEARQDHEKPRIAGVYLNRLRIRMPLQADPTVQYALMQLEGGTMRRLLFEDYKVQHPYNTYLYYGLPPGPINNPSPTSVDAVLFAEDHDYLYFVADGSGGHTFSRSLREHNRAANAYRRLMRERRQNAE